MVVANLPTKVRFAREDFRPFDGATEFKNEFKSNRFVSTRD